jgi:hypothetical protein
MLKAHLIFVSTLITSLLIAFKSQYSIPIGFCQFIILFLSSFGIIFQKFHSQHSIFIINFVFYCVAAQYYFGFQKFITPRSLFSKSNILFHFQNDLIFIVSFFHLQQMLLLKLLCFSYHSVFTKSLTLCFFEKLLMKEI